MGPALLALAGLVNGCTADQPPTSPPATSPNPTPAVPAATPAPETPAEPENIDANAFHSTATGFSVTKPDKWFFVPLDTPLGPQNEERLNDAALDQKIGQNATAPVVSIVQFDTPQDTFTPRVEVMLRPLGYLSDLSAVEILEVLKPTLTKELKDVTMTENITEVFVGGGLGAELTVTHTVTGANTQVLPVETRIIGVKRGKFLFQIAASISPEEQGAPRKLLATIVDSIRIQRP